MSRSLLVAFVLMLGACSGKSPSTETPTTGEPAAGDAGDAGDAGAGGECRPTGCSGIVCSDEDVMTTCEYRPEYACYQSATCTRQADGACGWTQTPELEACLANPPAE
jgi:hypothetical protein